MNGITENLSTADKADIAAAMTRGRRLMPDFPPDLMLEMLVTGHFEAMGVAPERAEELAAAEIAAMRRRAAAAALARAGRRGDRAVGHLTPGEMVVPKALLDRDPALKQTIVAALRAAGLDWRRYEVGGADDSANPAPGSGNTSATSTRKRRRPRRAASATPTLTPREPLIPKKGAFWMQGTSKNTTPPRLIR